MQDGDAVCVEYLYVLCAVRALVVANTELSHGALAMVCQTKMHIEDCVHARLRRVDVSVAGGGVQLIPLQVVGFLNVAKRNSILSPGRSFF